MGKGSAPRPFAVSNEEYANRWDAIWGRDQKEEKEKPNCDCNGMPEVGVMCSKVVVGGKLCGASQEFECKFKGK